MTQPANDDDRPTQVFLKRVLNVTLLLGFGIRILTPGWILIFFFIPLLIITSLHGSIVNGSIQKIPHTKSPYEYIILLSDLFFFTGCVFQVDAGDAPEYYVPILWRIPIPAESIWPDIFNTISMGSFVAMFFAWVLQLTLSQNVLKKENPS
jgi:hypothetical protein